MNRILITGGSGLLGGRVAETLAGTCEVFYTCNRNNIELPDCTKVTLDIVSPRCRDKIKEIKPDAVIHTAAITDVDYCETHQKEARSVNFDGASNVAIGCKAAGAKMVHISTDYVFDGTKGNYSETDQPNPINYYGQTKLESERKVAEILEDFAIARTTVIFGWNRKWQRKNFVAWAIGSLREGRKIRLVTDQYSSPTLAENLATALVELSSSDKTGVYHLVGRDCMSRFEFGQKIARIFGLDVGLIMPVTSGELAQTAPRPKKNCLCAERATSELGTRFFGAEEALLFMKSQEVAE